MDLGKRILYRLQNNPGEAFPFGVDFRGGDGGAVGAGEPVAGIASVAFDEVEQGVQPGSSEAGDFLGDVMGLFPTVGFDEPEGLGLRGQAGGRLAVGGSAELKLGGSHGRDRRWTGSGRAGRDYRIAG